MNVDPIVRKHRVTIDNQHHRQIVPIAQPLGSPHNFLGWQWFERLYQFSERHGRHKMGTIIVDVFARHSLSRHAINSSPAVPNAIDLDALTSLRTLLLHQRLASFPHHPRAKPWVMKLLD